MSLLRYRNYRNCILPSPRIGNPEIRSSWAFKVRLSLKSFTATWPRSCCHNPPQKSLKTTEPNAAEWVSKAIGRVEIQRMRETHYDGSRDGRNFSLDRQVEALVLDSEISGLENLRAFLKYGNHVTRFTFSYMNLPAEQPKFLERLANDYIDRSSKLSATKTETQTDMAVSTTTSDLPLAKEKSHKEQMVARQGETVARATHFRRTMLTISDH